MFHVRKLNEGTTGKCLVIGANKKDREQISSLAKSCKHPFIRVGVAVRFTARRMKSELLVLVDR